MVDPSARRTIVLCGEREQRREFFGGDAETFDAPGFVTATEADGRLVAVSLALARPPSAVSLDAHVLDPDGTEWRSLGSAEVDSFLEPVGIAGGRWMFAGSGPENRAAAVLDLTSGQWAEAAAPTGLTTGFLSAGAGDTVLAMAARFAHDTAPPQALSWDPATDTWTELAPPPLAHRVASAVAWTGSELLVWGGANTDGFGGPSFAEGAAHHP